jgi:hypothetical protein
VFEHQLGQQRLLSGPASFESGAVGAALQRMSTSLECGAKGAVFSVDRLGVAYPRVNSEQQRLFSGPASFESGAVGAALQRMSTSLECGAEGAAFSVD